MTSPRAAGFGAPRRPRPVLGNEALVADAATLSFDEADAARGTSTAVLAALARMQLRLDVMARQQADMFAAVMDAMQEFNDKLVFETPED